MRKHYLNTIACLLALSLTACINPQRPEPSTTESEKQTSETSAEPVSQTSQTKTETKTETDSEPESTQSTLRSVPLGEEFTISINETITLNQESENTYQLLLSAIYRNEETNFTSIEFECLDHDEYGDLGFYSDNDEVYINYTNFFGNYKISVLSNTAEHAVIRIDKRILKDPVTLSGDASETFTTTDYEYTETENCFIYFDKDISLPADIAVQIDDIYQKVEQRSGMKYMPENCFYQEDYSNITFAYFDSNPWEGINPDYHKINIYIIDDKNDKMWGSCSDNLHVVLIMQDLMYNGKVMSYIPAHEITHSVISKNFGAVNPIFTEGMAVKIGTDIENEDPDAANDALTYSGQDNANRGITADNAEEKFLNMNNYSEGEDVYDYGSNLIHYITEKYGNDSLLEYRDLFQQMKNPDEKYQRVSTEFENEVLKKQYGENFFTEFGTWYEQKHINEPLVIKAEPQ